MEFNFLSVFILDSEFRCMPNGKTDQEPNAYVGSATHFVKYSTVIPRGNTDKAKRDIFLVLLADCKLDHAPRTVSLRSKVCKFASLDEQN